MDTASELSLLLRGILALAVVVTLAVVSLRFGLPWLLRGAPAGAGRRITIEASCALDRQHRLYLVRCDDERLLVATSPGQVTLLARGKSAPGGTADATEGLVGAGGGAP
jgi:flagellar biogenesis protein FliO